MSEVTLAVIKPDGVKKGVVDQIRQRYVNAGLKVVRDRCMVMTEELATNFYAEHAGKNFFEGLVLSMTSGPSVFLGLVGPDAVSKVRELNGATDPRKAEPGTIRHDFLSAGGPFNTVHGSDGIESAAREISLIFDE